MKYNEAVRLIENDGWYQVRQKGSHRAFKHKSKPGIVTLAYHRLSDEVPPGTLNSILKQSGLKKLL
jgi:predicted RNA binding protein YcfA (HicA-like mRNA interferase family)